MPAAHIAITNECGELFRVVAKSDTPFRSTSSDVGQAYMRSSNDFQFMPRCLDLEALQEPDSEAAQPPTVGPKLALAMSASTHPAINNSEYGVLCDCCRREFDGPRCEECSSEVQYIETAIAGPPRTSHGPSMARGSC